jgi:hypothetical protein
MLYPFVSHGKIVMLDILFSFPVQGRTWRVVSVRDSILLLLFHNLNKVSHSLGILSLMLLQLLLQYVMLRDAISSLHGLS